MVWAFSGISLSASFLPLTESFFQLSNKLDERDPDRLADIAQFQQVNAAFPHFVLAYHGLGNMQLLSQIDLPQTRFNAYFSQQSQERVTFGPEFGHTVLYIPLQDIPN